MPKSLNVAVEGCCHGELDKIYATIRESEREGLKVDLLLVCGDFECVRNQNDLECVAVPPKYRKMNTFHEYVSGEKIAYVPTIFIGGNHEASNILQSYYYGGWVAPNIYFLGFAGVVWFGGLRISGISGIFNQRHYHLGHYEKPPYHPDSLRSIYHQRELEVYRLSKLSNQIDVFLSHDWPTGIWDYGDRDQLLRVKPYFTEEVNSGEMGSPPLMNLLKTLQPHFWFSAHLHVKFAAVVSHSLSDESRCTRFLALDKVLPGRNFLQILKIKTQIEDMPMTLFHDIDWLAILKQTHHLLHNTPTRVALPSNFVEITSQDKEEVEARMTSMFGGLEIPIYNEPWIESHSSIQQEGNHYTDRLLQALGLDHIWTIPQTTFLPSAQISQPLDFDQNELSIDDI